MSRKAFLLRIDPEVLAAVQTWAEEDLRSLNGQIEFLLREALRKRGVRPREERKKPRDDRADGGPGSG